MKVGFWMVVLPLLAFLAPATAPAQDNRDPRMALPTVLEETTFLALVRTHHPLAVRAELQRDRARALLQQARGGFDPKLYGDFDQKYFKGTQYYSTLEGGVKVPTWFGVELQASYERNDGVFLNEEQTVPEQGLYAAGLSVSLGRGLLFDERRAELRRARVFQDLTEAEREVELNNLLYDAGSAYWEWAEAGNVVEIYVNAVELAEERYEATLSRAALGDLPSIDTLEARIQLQNRELSLATAQLDLANAEANLNAYLWLDGVVPVELEPTTVPPEVEEVFVAPVLLGNQIFINPEIVRTRLKLAELEIDERLQREQLKPRVDVKYNALLAGGTAQPLEGVSSNNYKWGVTFDQPILLRKERGKLQLIRIKQSQTQLELSDKIALLEAKVEQALNEANITVNQYLLAERNADDYSVLLDGERELFRAGESSLFLVNSREVKYIEALIKQVETLVKHRKARLAYAYYEGRIAQTAAGGADVGPPIE